MKLKKLAASTLAVLLMFVSALPVSAAETGDGVIAAKIWVPEDDGAAYYQLPADDAGGAPLSRADAVLIMKILIPLIQLRG